jgi:L-rhamnose isomerase / sugar isomerase
MAHDYDTIRKSGLEYLKSAFSEEAVEFAVEQTQKFEVEVPGWQFWAGFGGGGRFDSGSDGGAARNTTEIAEDAGMVHTLTRSAPTVGLHVLWFLSRDNLTGDMDVAGKVARELQDHGVEMGSISPTYFLAGSEDGSFTAQDRSVRQGYIEQTVLAARIAAGLSNGVLSLWFPDGTNYPGQRNLQEKIGLMAESLSSFWEKTPPDVQRKLRSVLVEYKLFEPGTYSTTIPDWGTALELSRIFPDRGGVLVDLGHHAHGTNVEQIVAALISSNVRGGFHFNARYAADDDHSVQADYQLARIFYELLQGRVVNNPDRAENWFFALDQMARTEQRIPSVLKSIDALKRSVAKAALANIDILKKLQKAQDLIGSNTEFEQALLHADTAAVVMESYHRQGLHPVPLDAYRDSGYQEKIAKNRR